MSLTVACSKTEMRICTVAIKVMCTSELNNFQCSKISVTFVLVLPRQS